MHVGVRPGEDAAICQTAFRRFGGESSLDRGCWRSRLSPPAVGLYGSFAEGITSLRVCSALVRLVQGDSFGFQSLKRTGVSVVNQVWGCHDFTPQAGVAQRLVDLPRLPETQGARKSLRATATTARFLPRLPPCSASLCPHRLKIRVGAKGAWG